MFAREPNLVKAARKVMKWAPAWSSPSRASTARRCSWATVFALPAFPLETVQDPTGAGDSFAGGFLGYMASLGSEALSDQAQLAAP